MYGRLLSKEMYEKKLGFRNQINLIWPVAMETCQCMAAFLVSFQSAEVLDIYIFY